MNDHRPIIAANWKMHKTPQEGVQFAEQLTTKVLSLGGINFILAPSATGLFHIHEALQGSAIELAGQNMHFAAKGAYTGENSAAMLMASGCRWVIIGHSERRYVFHESDEDIRKKIPAALSAGLKVVHCIGERIEERQAGRTGKILHHQISNDLADMSGFPADNLVIAYEPVWAIGTGVVATPEQAREAHAQIREIVKELFPGASGKQVKILYGGSVKSDNATALIRTPGIDGFLIGGASLDVHEYYKIAEITAAEALDNQ